MAERLSGVGVAYARRSRRDHRLVGRRVPDVDCNGTRLYQVLRGGAFILLTRGPLDRTIEWPGLDHVSHSAPELPEAVLVRPDGYIAWASVQLPAAGDMAEVLTHWCGQPAGVRHAVR